MSTAPPIDLAHLAQYTGGDAALEAELLQMFVPNAAQYIEAMAAAAAGPADQPAGQPSGGPPGPGAERTPWHEAAHTLKGAARSIGAVGLAGLAEAAEAAAAADRAAHLAALRAEFGRIRAFVERHTAA